MRLEFAPGQVVADSDLRSLGLVPVYRREASVLAAYARDGDLSTFTGQLDSYSQLRKKAIRPAYLEDQQDYTVVVTLESEDDQVNVFNIVRTRLGAGRVRVRVPAG